MIVLVVKSVQMALSAMQHHIANWVSELFLRGIPDAVRKVVDFIPHTWVTDSMDLFFALLVLSYTAIGYIFLPTIGNGINNVLVGTAVGLLHATLVENYTENSDTSKYGVHLSKENRRRHWAARTKDAECRRIPALLFACCDKGRLTSVESLLRTMEFLPVPPRAYAWGCYFAASRGHLDIVDAISQQQRACLYVALPVATAHGETVLHAAAAAGHQHIVRRLLVHYKLNPNFCRSQDDMTPLHLACIEGHTQIVRMLLDAGSDPLARVRPSGMTPLHLVARRPDGCPEVARALLVSTSPSAVLRAVDKVDKYTALHVACMHGNINVVRAILVAARDILEKVVPRSQSDLDNERAEDEFTAFVNHRSPDRLHTPLLCACGSNSIELSRLLLAHGATVTNRFLNQGTTPPALAIAARNGNEALALLLVAHGASPKVKTPNGCTISEYALRLGHARLSYLLSIAADMSRAQLLAHTGLHEEARKLLTQGSLDPCETGGAAVFAVTGAISRQPPHCRRSRRRCSKDNRRMRPTRLRVQPSAMDIARWGGYFSAVTAFPGSVWNHNSSGGMPDTPTSFLFREAQKHWVPSRHSLFGPRVRQVIRVLLLVHSRLQQQAIEASYTSSSTHERGQSDIVSRVKVGQTPSLFLPVEMWLLVFRFLRRKDYMTCDCVEPNQPTTKNAAALGSSLPSWTANSDKGDGSDVVASSQSWKKSVVGGEVKLYASNHDSATCACNNRHPRASRIIRMRSADDDDDVLHAPGRRGHCRSRLQQRHSNA
eukprot:m.149120 g.149120  ORF g.149120 m.149120 type:complete len:773 (-) comp17804_c0_seq2:178-2496(-)